MAPDVLADIPDKDELQQFTSGRHFSAYNLFGAHLPSDADDRPGARFVVWAPAAARVSVVGDFNDWKPNSHRLERLDHGGLWCGWVAEAKIGSRYKYWIRSRAGGKAKLKADPFARWAEVAPSTASRVWRSEYRWHDRAWLDQRRDRNAIDAALSIYELHLGSWRRGDDGRLLSYREIAPLLADHIEALGFTHVELMPVMEHPFDGSWGYQITGYFAPSARFGDPDGLKYLIDQLHQRNIGVILDWVPSHFPTDPHGLGSFDGTYLYEHADPRKGFHPDWKSLIFNYRRPQVTSFLVSNACYWIDQFHADGLRVDAVASMLYLDYSRDDGEWEPNEHGGRENLDAITFLRALNTEVYHRFPDVQMFAEESTSWPMVTKPVHLGGLGFGIKWDMGWMHDTLDYFDKDSIHRSFHHGKLTFRPMYATSENFLLPLSHDEVVHGKGSLLGKMPGDEWRKFANLRLLLAYQYATTGQKLSFMGTELAPWREWSHERQLDWNLGDYDLHRGVGRLLEDLNRMYRATPSLYQDDHNGKGFEWVEANDVDQSVFAFLRGRAQDILVVINATPVVRSNYRLGVPQGGRWSERLNSDSEAYGGSGVGNLGGVDAHSESSHLRPYSIELTLPPLGALFLQHEGSESGGPNGS